MLYPLSYGGVMCVVLFTGRRGILAELSRAGERIDQERRETSGSR